VSWRQQSVAQCDRRAPSEFRNTVMPTTSAPFAMVDEGRPSSMRVASMYRAAQAQYAFVASFSTVLSAGVFTQSSLTHTLGPFCDTSSVAADWFSTLQHRPSGPKVDRAVVGGSAVT
jgi:hypothetical protein